jgi:hypothetical protein
MRRHVFLLRVSVYVRSNVHFLSEHSLTVHSILALNICPLKVYFAGHAEDFGAERRALHDVKGLPLLRACGPTPAPYCAPSEIDARGVPNIFREGTTCKPNLFREGTTCEPNLLSG